MDTPADSPNGSSDRRRREGLHPTGLVVAVVGLTLSVVGYSVAYRDLAEREDQRREEVADIAADDVAVVLADIESLVSGIEGTLIATREPIQSEVNRLLSLLVERSELMRGASLLNAEGGAGINVFGQTGGSQFVDIEDIIADPELAATRAGQLADLTNGEYLVIGTVDGDGEPIVGIATAFTTRIPADREKDIEAMTRSWVVAVEVVFPRSTLDALHRLTGNPDLSVYVGTEKTPDTLLFSTGPVIDVDATERTVALGNSKAVMALRPTGDLLDPGEEILPLMVFLAGLALTTLLTPLVARLANRREEVRVLSAQRDELDDALTVSRQIERELRSSEQRFRSVLQSSPDIVLWIDNEGGTIQVLNRPDFLGYPFEQILDIDELAALAHDDDRDAVTAGLARLRSAPAGTITEFEARFRQANETYEWLRIRGGRVQRDDDTEGPILAVLTTVTEQKREEERRAQLESQLVQSQRLEAVGQLAGGVAHDFNNILAAIVSGAELVVDEVDGQVKDDVEEIRRTARRGSDLARQLLLFSRRDRGSAPEVVDVNDVITDIETMLRRTLDESVELRTQLGDDLYEVHIDPSQIERVLMNLTINARDAMPGGGVVTIATANVDAGADFVSTRPDLDEGAYVCLTVSDNGAGMPESVRQHAFEPFFSTKEVGKGTGLGLATVYGIVQGAQGHIEIDSDVGTGTTFTMLLPRSHLGRRAASSGVDVESELGGSERILLVEDEDTVREATRRLLQKRGYQVKVAADGNAAVELTAQPFDVLLTDILMPGGMNGRDVSLAVRKRQPRIAVLYMTGHSDDVLENVGIDDDEGEDEALVVRKPFTEDELLRAIRLAIARVPEPA